VTTVAERPLAAGGIEWLEGLFRSYQPGLLRLARTCTGDDGIAEELVQEAFVRLHRSGTRPQPGAELAYLRRTVVNLSHSRGRRLAVARRAPADREVDGASAEFFALAQARREAIVRAVRALPGRQRDCVVLHYLEELSDAQIAATLGIGVGSVKTHLHRARAALAARLEDER
jgi:RNA polymerase sigma-70 factor (ECF subfamily)